MSIKPNNKKTGKNRKVNLKVNLFDKTNQNNKVSKNICKVNKTKKIKASGLKGKLKVFDKNLSDRYDTRARDIIKECLGNGVIDNPHSFGADMMVVTNRIPYGYIELQVYGQWTDDKFPHPMPYIYERKMNFSNNTLFVCFNASFEKAIIFSKSCIDSKKYRAKKYSREYIHYIPWHKTLRVDVSKLTYERILCYCDPATYFEILEAKELGLNADLQSESTIDVDMYA
jgi:hypothetical protein